MNVGTVLLHAGCPRRRETDRDSGGMQEEAKEFGAFMANEGAEQCGFCNPGFIMNVFTMLKELEDPTEEDILEYLSEICAVARDLWDRPEVS